MTIELAAVEPVSKPGSRFGGTPLQQFAKAGLALSIVDFRKMCEEISQSPIFADSGVHDLADVLFAWLTRTSEQ